MKNLDRKLYECDHKSYPAYKSLKGSYVFPKYVLAIDHVQGDPFAAPSALSIHVRAESHGFPGELFDTPHRKKAMCDFLLRAFGRELSKFSHRARGSGKSGSFSVSNPGQEILRRSAASIEDGSGELVIRFYAGFPAAGRTTLSDELKKMLMEYVPEVVKRSLFYQTCDKERLNKWIKTADHQKTIRDSLPKLGLTAFVADGAVLPRKSGVDDSPMESAVIFKSPAEDSVTIDLGDGSSISGMGIKKGITLIVGGGYHGKSTLLKALERGVYDHIPGDGREYVITEDSAVKVRAEDGRSVTRLDISGFIRNLPNKKDTVDFSTEDASGSTSQAACTVEAVLSGAKTLLIDEDTSATNFMVRDRLMQTVISPDKEPIIPFSDRMRELFEEFGVSTVLVAGSSGAFFELSDTIIQMDEYIPRDITELAKKAALPYSEGLRGEKEEIPPLTKWADRRVPKENRAVTDARRVKTKGQGTNAVILNHESVEVRFVEQVVDPEQTNMLGLMLKTLEESYFNGQRSLSECLRNIYSRFEKNGFGEVANDMIPGNLAEVRFFELYAMVNRYRGLLVK